MARVRQVVPGREVAEFISAAMEQLVSSGEKVRNWLLERVIITHDTNPGGRGPFLPEWIDDWNQARERDMKGLVLFRRKGVGGADMEKIVRRFKVEAKFLVYRDRSSVYLYVNATPLGQVDEEQEEILARARTD